MKSEQNRNQIGDAGPQTTSEKQIEHAANVYSAQRTGENAMNPRWQTQFRSTFGKTLASPIRRRWVSKVLASCPRSGDGVHHWLFVTALKLHEYFPDKSKLARLLALASGDCGREVSNDEIWNAIVNSQPIAESTTGNLPHKRCWPKRNEERIERVVKAGPTFAQLEASSPVRWNDGQPHTEEIIDILFPGNPLLCATPNKELPAITRTREEWRGLMSNQQFIVPSLMTSIFGKTKSGEDSMRSLANTGPRRFLVVEFDQGDFDQHAALLVHLGKFAPLVLAVHSGNKSLHGWFFCGREPDEKVERFFRYAVGLGADRAIWTPCQLVRMPDGRRDDEKHQGVRQRIVYFNPQALETKTGLKTPTATRSKSSTQTLDAPCARSIYPSVWTPFSSKTPGTLCKYLTEENDPLMPSNGTNTVHHHSDSKG